MGGVKLALLGCGDVAQRDYLPEFHRLGARAEIVAVCGRTRGRAETVAAQYGIPHVYTDYRQMFAETDADAVINLTPIQLHTETTLAALAAGKHVYTEKPVASTVVDAVRIRDAAAAAQRKLVCAPCVMLFPQVRYARKLLTEAVVLGPIYSAAGHGLMGVPPWHGYTSDPSPFFAHGGGAAMDMGVYPLHALTGLLGPVYRVTAMISKVLTSFVVEDGMLAGQRIPVEADDNWKLILDFGGGRLATLAANSVIVGTRAPMLELHGLLGTLALDVIDVGAPVDVLRDGDGWKQIAPPFPIQNATGRAAGPDHHLGIEHLVDCIEFDRTPILNIDHALHVIDVLEQAAISARTGQAQTVTSHFPIPSKGD